MLRCSTVRYNGRVECTGLGHTAGMIQHCWIILRHYRLAGDHVALVWGWFTHSAAWLGWVLHVAQWTLLVKHGNKKSTGVLLVRQYTNAETQYKWCHTYTHTHTQTYLHSSLSLCSTAHHFMTSISNARPSSWSVWQLPYSHESLLRELE